MAEIKLSSAAVSLKSAILTLFLLALDSALPPRQILNGFLSADLRALIPLRHDCRGIMTLIRHIRARSAKRLRILPPRSIAMRRRLMRSCARSFRAMGAMQAMSARAVMLIRDAQRRLLLIFIASPPASPFLNDRCRHYGDAMRRRALTADKKTKFRTDAPTQSMAFRFTKRYIMRALSSFATLSLSPRGCCFCYHIDNMMLFLLATLGYISRTIDATSRWMFT